MTSTGLNPWKMKAIALALAVVIVAITGAVVANWSGTEKTQTVETSTTTTKTHVAKTAPAAPPVPAAVVAPPPSQAVVDACNQQAEAQLRQREEDVAVLRECLVTMQSKRSSEIEARVIP